MINNDKTNILVNYEFPDQFNNRLVELVRNNSEALFRQFEESSNECKITPKFRIIDKDINCIELVKSNFIKYVNIGNRYTLCEFYEDTNKQKFTGDFLKEAIPTIELKQTETKIIKESGEYCDKAIGLLAIFNLNVCHNCKVDNINLSAFIVAN